MNASNAPVLVSGRGCLGMVKMDKFTWHRFYYKKNAKKKKKKDKTVLLLLLASEVSQLRRQRFVESTVGMKGKL